MTHVSVCSDELPQHDHRLLRPTRRREPDGGDGRGGVPGRRPRCPLPQLRGRPGRPRRRRPRARAMGWAGFNCSIPHKVAVIAHLDELAPSASIIGAVNCVVRRDDRLIGENTDGQGFLASLRTVVDPAGKHVVVVRRRRRGAGDHRRDGPRRRGVDHRRQPRPPTRRRARPPARRAHAGGGDVRAVGRIRIACPSRPTSSSTPRRSACSRTSTASVEPRRRLAAPARWSSPT